MRLGKQLLVALRDGDEKRIEHLLEQGAWWHREWAIGRAMEKIIMRSCHDLFRAMACRFRDPSMIPLDLAVAHGDEEMVRAALDLGAPVNALYGRTHPMAQCAATGTPGIAAILLDHGADLVGRTRADTINKSIVSHAIKAGNAPMLDYLCIRAREHVLGWGGEDFLGLAAFNLEEGMVETLLNTGLSVHRSSSIEQPSCLLSLLGAKPHPNRIRILNRLLAAGANPSRPDEYGNTPLYHAVIHGAVDCARAMVEHGADVNAKNGEAGWSLFHATLLASDESREMVDFLIEAGADPTAVDNHGKMAIEYQRDRIQRPYLQVRTQEAILAASTQTAFGGKPKARL